MDVKIPYIKTYPDLFLRERLHEVIGYSPYMQTYIETTLAIGFITEELRLLVNIANAPHLLDGGFDIAEEYLDMSGSVGRLIKYTLTNSLNGAYLKGYAEITTNIKNNNGKELTALLPNSLIYGWKDSNTNEWNEIFVDLENLGYNPILNTPEILDSTTANLWIKERNNRIPNGQEAILFIKAQLQEWGADFGGEGAAEIL